MTRWCWLRLLVAAWLTSWLAPPDASAHAVGSSYLELQWGAEPQQVSGHWRVGLQDLDAALTLDRDGDGQIADAELSERRAAIEGYLLARLELTGGERPCPLAARGLSSVGGYVTLELAALCAGPLALRYDLFFEHDRSHQGHLHVSGGQSGAAEQDYIFTSERRSLTFATQPASASGAWLEYLGQGVLHILGGVDHLLFLLTLLLSLLRRRAPDSAEGSRESPSSLRSTLLDIGKIVTAFTVAHSLTLTLMALGLVALPARWVETAIALSIVAAAANNVWPVVRRRVWLLAFGFGLLHGLGFGGALRELGLPEGRLLIALLGFNLGVELGQLAVVIVCFFAVWGLQRLLPGTRAQRGRQQVQRAALVYGSALVGAVGLIWSLERALEVSWSSQLWSPGAAPLLREASSEAAPLPRSEEADTLARLAEQMVREERWADVYRLYDEARALHEAAGDTRGLAQDLSRLGDVLVSAADPPAAKRQYEKSRAAYEQLADEAGVAAQYRNLAIVARLNGDETEAAQMYRRALVLHRRQGHPPDVAVDLAALARIQLGAGQYDEAQALYEEANAIESQLGRTRALARNHNQLGNLHQLRGDLVAAEAQYREALGYSERAGDSTEAANNCANLAAVYHKQGQRTRARELYEKSLGLFEQSGARAKVLRVRGLLASLDTTP